MVGNPNPKRLVGPQKFRIDTNRCGTQTGIFAVPSTPIPTACRSQRGLDAEKPSPISSGEFFLLTSPFIEPVLEYLGSYRVELEESLCMESMNLASPTACRFASRSPET